MLSGRDDSNSLASIAIPWIHPSPQKLVHLLFNSFFELICDGIKSLYNPFLLGFHVQSTKNGPHAMNKFSLRVFSLKQSKNLFEWLRFLKMDCLNSKMETL